MLILGSQVIRQLTIRLSGYPHLSGFIPRRSSSSSTLKRRVSESHSFDHTLLSVYLFSPYCVIHSVLYYTSRTFGPHHILNDLVTLGAKPDLWRTEIHEKYTNI
jgi:hypothetical protein